MYVGSIPEQNKNNLETPVANPRLIGQFLH